ncbi:MAG: MBL fold metallo-hydrolase [Isosphaera sp.]|nr:MBL fold metallo-hydrolase [Isosphaera sp.]
MGMPDQVAGGVFRVRLSIVNAYLVGPAGAADRGWVLVDAGLSISLGAIRAAAAAVYGPGSRPAAVVLTHGHFDHVGALKPLAEGWDAPVYAHRLELPYLTGRSDYPPPDPSVGGGLMALLSPLYSRRGIDLSGLARPLPEGGAVPAMPGWRSVHTPGHTPGHVSFFRDADRTLIAGDAFVTTRQESAVAAVFKPRVIHGPPAYFTTDWDEAERSVRRLAQLRPEVAATGHGVPVRGEEMRKELARLAADFRRAAVPSDGRYVRSPARADENGTFFVPPPAPAPLPTVLAGTGLAVAAGYWLGRPARG